EWLTQLLLRSREIPCPFFRRRAGDAVESALALLHFLISRHKSIDIRPCAPMGPKLIGCSVEEVMGVVREDIESRRYYISGRITQAVYSDRCFFDGPDPDMPVRSLQRYSDALRGLFDPVQSKFELLELSACGRSSFTASWRLEGALRVPGRPRIKPYLGTTLYELDEDGLICSHTETWSISAIDAFVSVLFPKFGAAPAPPADVLRRQMQSGAARQGDTIYVPTAPPRRNPSVD
ncbi:MAG: hypothetical protein SGPRY_011791, partial [Prymnesium sp.]